MLATDPDGGWLHGEAALARRIVAPKVCVMDLLQAQDEQAWAARAEIWPFAAPQQHPEHGVCWEVQDKLYPRAYLLSRILVFARELAETHAQTELRSMALIAGRTVEPSLRRDLEQAAKIAGVHRLWWVDRMHALARAMLLQRQQADLESVPSEALAKAEDEQDALSQIDQVLGVAASGPRSAQLSHAEFAAQPSLTPDAQTPDEEHEASSPEDLPEQSEQSEQSEQAPEQAQTSNEDENDAQELHAHASGESELEDAHDARVQDSTPDGGDEDEPSADHEVSKDLAAAGQWFWVADQLGLELAQLSLDPDIELRTRDLILGVSQLDWQTKVVAQLHKDLQEVEGLSLNESRLAQVRIWDACEKMMDRLATEAQTDLHLPHLCVRKDQSYHYQGSWSRRRMDALVADAVAQLKARCQDPDPSNEAASEDDVAWQWGRYGSASEMPAFVRVAQQCSWLLRKDAKLPVNSALVGAGSWIEERTGSGSRKVSPDLMLGDLEWVHPSGGRKRVATHGQALPLTLDLDLQDAQIESDDEETMWRLDLCLAGGQEGHEHRRCVTRIVMSDYAKDGRVRVEVQRNAKIVVSRCPAAKNAGAKDLVTVATGLSSEQLSDLEIDQSRRDVDRFMGMRSQAMRKELAKHCTELGTILSERGEKMDDLLRTRLGEWVGHAKSRLAQDPQDQSNKEALAELTPLHEGFLQMVETFSPQQKKSLAIELLELPQLLELPAELGMPTGTQPYWAPSL